MMLNASPDRLGISYRQTKHQYQRYLSSGYPGLIHGLRGRRCNNRQVVHAMVEHPFAWLK